MSNWNAKLDAMHNIQHLFRENQTNDHFASSHDHTKRELQKKSKSTIFSYLNQLRKSKLFSPSCANDKEVETKGMKSMI